MIAVKLHGRLGNQLFQYAFGLATARRLGIGFYVVRAPDSFVLERGFALGPEFKGELTEAMLKKRMPDAITVDWPNSRPASEIESHLADNRVYSGFFQSRAYFEHAAADVHRHLRPTLRSRLRHAWLRRKLGITNEDYTVVHVRRGDYLSWQSAEFGGTGFALPAAYYRNASMLLAKHTPKNGRTLLIGDDPAFAASEVAPLFKHATVIAGNTPLDDFMLLRHAKHMVISNSSFAWWAARLNAAKDRRVIAPRFWLGHHLKRELPAGIVEPEWQRTDIE